MRGAPRAPRRLPRTRSRAPRPRASAALAAGARRRGLAALRAPRRVEESRAGRSPPGAVPGAPPSASHAVAAAGPVSPSGRRLAVEEDLVVVAWSPAMGGWDTRAGRRPGTGRRRPGNLEPEHLGQARYEP